MPILMLLGVRSAYWTTSQGLVFTAVKTCRSKSSFKPDASFRFVHRANREGARMATTTKKDLIDRIADTTQQRRADVKRTVQAFLDQVIDELGRGNRLEFRDFGVFEIKERAPRVAQNPKTLERVHVPARRTVKFKVGRLMRETLSQPEEAVEIVGQINID
jgi:integration host factor subunit beta